MTKILSPGYGIRDEVSKLEVAAVFDPGVETYIGTLAPSKNLFFSNFDILRGREEHSNLVNILEKEGVKIVNFRDVLAEILEPSKTKMKDIVEKLKKNYPNVNEAIAKRLIDIDVERYGEEKAATLISNLCFHTSKKISGYTLANIYFLRDQSNIVGKKVILSNMKFDQRRPEVRLIKSCLDYAGAENYVPVKDPGTFEGGDAMIKDGTLFFGIGMRTNTSGLKQIVREISGDFDEIVGIKMPKGFDKIMNFMHTDTYLNMVDKNLVTINKALAEKCVLFDLKKGFVKIGDLWSYIRRKNYETILIPTSEQKSWATNFLTLRPGVVAAPSLYNKETYKILIENGVKIIGTNTRELSQGCGGLHCMVLPLIRGKAS